MVRMPDSVVRSLPSALLDGVTARPRLAWGALSALLSLAPTSHASAQASPPCPEPFVLPVQVRASTGGPVADASVVVPIQQRRFITDAEGRFSVPGVCPGPLQLSVSHISYGTITLVREALPDRALVIDVDPRPIALDGLLVAVETVTRRLERRRKASGFKSGVFNAEDVRDEEPPSDIPAYVAARTGHPLTACDPSETFGERNCYPFRGGLARVRTVCIDGNPAGQGPAALDQVVQQADIARLEFYPSAGVMRIYTRAYLLLAAEKSWLLADPVDRC